MKPRSHFWFHRSAVLAVLLLGAITAFMPGRQRVRGTDIPLDRLLPKTIGPWTHLPLPPSPPPSMLAFLDQTFTGVYTSAPDRALILTVEYSGDFRRRNEVHIPEYCHRQRGDQVTILDRLSVPVTPAVAFPAILMEWENPQLKKSAVCAFWLVVDGQQTADLLHLKLNQLMAGILNRTKDVVLVRVDAFAKPGSASSGRAERIKMIESFVRDLFGSSEPATRLRLFGTGA